MVTITCDRCKKPIDRASFRTLHVGAFEKVAAPAGYGGGIAAMASTGGATHVAVGTTSQLDLCEACRRNLHNEIANFLRGH